jgi:hypothetical protein
MTESQLVYELKIPIELSCRPGGGIDVHYAILELPQGAKLRSTAPSVLDCWPLLPEHTLVNTMTYTVDVAPAAIPQFDMPEETTPAGTDLGSLQAEYMESIYDVVYEPYEGTDSVSSQNTAIENIPKLRCPDGAPPIAVADPQGNITYRCRDGSVPESVVEAVLSTITSPLNIPHFDETTEQVTATVPRVRVRAQTTWSNIPLPAIGCCTSTATVTTTASTASTTATSTGGPSTATDPPTAPP